MNKLLFVPEIQGKTRGLLNILEFQRLKNVEHMCNRIALLALFPRELYAATVSIPATAARRGNRTKGGGKNGYYCVRIGFAAFLLRIGLSLSPGSESSLA